MLHLPMNQGPMLRFLPHLLAVLLLLAPCLASAESGFPKPAGLVPDVEFWKKVFGTIDTGEGFIHDARDLSIIYETASVPAELSRRGSSRKIKARNQHYKAILQRLAKGKRTGLSAEEKRVLGLFPGNVSNATLRKASQQIRFQRGQANKFRQGLIRQGRWERYMRQVFRDRGLPVALTALPHVESSFNPKARSHVGASGLWQFTRGTGRLYMRVDHVVDERNDPHLATVAAARLLGANHKRLGTWPLALTAYNHGAGGMARAKRKLGTSDIETVVRKYKSRTFGFASRNFYVEFLAAHELQQNPKPYFGEVTKEPSQMPEIVMMKDFVKATDLAKALGVTTTSLRESNPALRQPVWDGQKYVPKGYPLRIARDPARDNPEALIASLSSGVRHGRQIADRSYRVRKGDTLSRIASRHGVRMSELSALNGLRSRHKIRVGQVLKLPVRAGGAPVVRQNVARAERPEDGRYRVRRGDTIGKIAQRFGVSQSSLRAENGLSSSRIKAGQTLRIPAGKPVVTAKNTLRVYKIRPGDTLDKIAKRFGVTRSALVSQNRIRNANRLQVGQRLTIPAN